jgi:hypothetical protein
MRTRGGPADPAAKRPLWSSFRLSAVSRPVIACALGTPGSASVGTPRTTRTTRCRSLGARARLPPALPRPSSRLRPLRPRPARPSARPARLPLPRRRPAGLPDRLGSRERRGRWPAGHAAAAPARASARPASMSGQSLHCLAGAAAAGAPPDLERRQSRAREGRTWRGGTWRGIPKRAERRTWHRSRNPCDRAHETAPGRRPFRGAVGSAAFLGYKGRSPG